MTEQLAIDGGEPTVRAPAPHYVWPPRTPEIRQAVIDQLEEEVSIYDCSGVIDRFESEFAKLHSQTHALLCNSGTNALHSLFFGVGLGPGDEVICPAYTFFASVTPMLFMGSIPVLCDCDDSGNIDPDLIVQHITPRTRAVLVTHMWGIPCQYERLRSICDHYNLLLLEDCSHAHGATASGKLVGSLADGAVWSLQGQKLITAGEGGILVTSDDELFYRAVMLGHYNKRAKQQLPADHPLAQYATTGFGLKYRSHPLGVAMAISLLHQLPCHAAARRQVASRFRAALAGLHSIQFPKVGEGDEPSWYALVFQYRAECAGNRSIADVHRMLGAEGLVEIDLPRSTQPLNYLPLFKKPSVLFPTYRGRDFGYCPGQFPVAEKFYRQAIKVPVWLGVQDSEAELVDGYIKGMMKVFSRVEDQ